MWARGFTCEHNVDRWVSRWRQEEALNILDQMLGQMLVSLLPKMGLTGDR